MADTKDFKAAIAASTDPDERLRLARRLAVRRLASSATHNLDQAYAALMAPSTVTAG
jgi:hypothetical protein